LLVWRYFWGIFISLLPQSSAVPTGRGEERDVREGSPIQLLFPRHALAKFVGEFRPGLQGLIRLIELAKREVRKTDGVVGHGEHLHLFLLPILQQLDGFLAKLRGLFKESVALCGDY